MLIMLNIELTVGFSILSNKRNQKVTDIFNGTNVVSPLQSSIMCNSSQGCVAQTTQPWATSWKIKKYQALI